MSKYTWLKQSKDFYKTKMMRFLQRQADGLELIFIYQNMMLLSLENEGKIIYEEFEDSLAEEIYYEIDSPLVTLEGIQLLLDLLEQKGMIQQEGNDFLLVEVLNMIGSEANSTERVKRHRSKRNKPETTDSVSQVTSNEVKQDETLQPVSCNEVKHDETLQSVTCNKVKHDETLQSVSCNTEKEKEREKDKELEKEKEKEKEKKKSQRSGAACSEVIAFINELTGKRMSLENEAYHSAIRGRLKEGYTVQDLKDVARYQNDVDWKNWDGRMKSMNPKTLYCRSNFLRYIENLRSSPPVSPDDYEVINPSFSDEELRESANEDVPF